MTQDFLIQLLSMAGAAVGVYAGIRADIAAMRAGLEHVSREVARAHDRISDLMDRR